MAIPRVFISSTCYDLKNIRENLKYFVRTIGYEPVLSDDGDVFYDPTKHTHDSCLEEVATCQIFVLVIGGRYGGNFKDSESSITNKEYRTAVENDIPIFTLVDSTVLAEHHIYIQNKENKDIDERKVKYPSSDNTRIFDFIDEVRKKSKGNALQPFRNFSEIESYLQKQWAGMMFEFLQRRKSEEQLKITNNLIGNLSIATQKTEDLVKSLLGQLAKEEAPQLIDNAETKASAAKFTSLVKNKFGIDYIRDTFNGAPAIPDKLPNSFEEYLNSLPGFSIEDLNTPTSDIDTVLIGPNNTGINIRTTKNRGLNSSSLSTYMALEKSYADLKKLPPEEIETILKPLVEVIIE